jgi:hypothetical protein
MLSVQETQNCALVHSKWQSLSDTHLYTLRVNSMDSVDEHNDAEEHQTANCDLQWRPLGSLFCFRADILVHFGIGVGRVAQAHLCALHCKGARAACRSIFGRRKESAQILWC